MSVKLTINDLREGVKFDRYGERCIDITIDEDDCEWGVDGLFDDQEAADYVRFCEQFKSECDPDDGSFPDDDRQISLAVVLEKRDDNRTELGWETMLFRPGDVTWDGAPEAVVWCYETL